MFNRILVPLDGSMFAERALEPALNLAQANKSELILLRSVIPVHMMMPEFAGEYECSNFAQISCTH